MKKLILSIAAIVGLSAGAATATTLSFDGATGSTVISNNDLGLGLDGLTIDFITGDLKDATNGLSVDTGAVVTYTYLGFEAANSNFVSNSSGTPGFINGSSSVGDTISVTQGPGLLEFAFGTSAPASAVGFFDNAGTAAPASSAYAIGAIQLTSSAFLVLFDDIAANNRDFDDIGILVKVAPIPLPAAGILLATALGGIGLYGRRRRTA
ncbi:MAG: VPLPA-CTERM sorting domain-containing protein [Pseudomonadota bacterium]